MAATLNFLAFPTMPDLHDAYRFFIALIDPAIPLSLHHL